MDDPIGTLELDAMLAWVRIDRSGGSNRYCSRTLRFLVGLGMIDAVGYAFGGCILIEQVMERYAPCLVFGFSPSLVSNFGDK
jgi:hypothetical protein